MKKARGGRRREEEREGEGGKEKERERGIVLFFTFFKKVKTLM